MKVAIVMYASDKDFQCLDGMGIQLPIVCEDIRERCGLAPITVLEGNPEQVRQTLHQAVDDLVNAAVKEDWK